MNCPEHVHGWRDVRPGRERQIVMYLGAAGVDGLRVVEGTGLCPISGGQHLGFGDVQLASITFG